MNAASAFVRDVLCGLTWRTLLLAQLLVLALELIAVLSFVVPFQSPPPSFVWARLLIDEIIGVSIIVAVLAGNQAIARGARPFAAYATAILVAAAAATLTQYQLRHLLHIYTNGDRPGVAPSQRRMQMVYPFSDTLTYGVLFTLMYVDYQRRERSLRRLREAELRRAQRERGTVQSRLAAVRSSIDAEELMSQLVNVERMLANDSADAEARLDELIADLRARVAHLDANRSGAPA